MRAGHVLAKVAGVMLRGEAMSDGLEVGRDKDEDVDEDEEKDEDEDETTHAGLINFFRLISSHPLNRDTPTSLIPFSANSMEISEEDEDDDEEEEEEGRAFRHSSVSLFALTFNTMRDDEEEDADEEDDTEEERRAYMPTFVILLFDISRQHNERHLARACAPMNT